MTLQIPNPTPLQTPKSIGRTAVRCPALLLVLAISWLATSTVDADIISVTSVTDNVRIQTSPDSIRDGSASNLSGNAFGVTAQFFNESGPISGLYSSNQSTANTGTSLASSWFVEIPSDGSPAPTAQGRGDSTILFTALSDSEYTASGGSSVPDNTIVTLYTYQLRDLTAGVDLVQYTGGSDFNGNQIDNLTGSLTGDLILGNEYSWSSTYRAGKRAAFPDLELLASGNARLDVTAVPEPSSIAILGIGVAGVVARRRFRSAVKES